ncbi:hypothetical protein ICR46_002600 [Vibrio cholerae]|nr:hypothetical protein [Vibrio cholerae]BCN21645.1 putative O-antigen polymerase [Vibrio cholerae]GIA03933.1 hypothetical protein VCSRO83_2692 [Vibrio cholerae]
MEIANFCLFITSLFFARKNLIVVIYIILLFLFCYVRYIVSLIDSNYLVGAMEWVFPGVSDEAVNVYSMLYLILGAAVLVCGIFVKDNRVGVLYVTRKFYFNIFVTFSILLLSYKTLLLFSVLIENGYLAVVDFRIPTWLSIFSSSLVKPIVLSLALLYASKKDRFYLLLFFLMLFLMALSGQRKDLVTILIFFICCLLSPDKNRWIKLVFSLVLIYFLAMTIFYLREDGFSFSGYSLVDLFWGIGFSVNSGLFVVGNPSSFSPLDSLGFINTYWHCGLGRLFSDLCYNSERLNAPGFLLEKIANHLTFENETLFGGIGGNLLGSIYVASGLNEQLNLIALLYFVLFCFMTTLLVILFICYIPVGVTYALIVTNLIVSSRYAFDGFIPPVNQLLVAIFIDVFFIKKYTSLGLNK